MNVGARRDGESHAEYAYRIMRTNILDLTMKPGTVINEGDIAEQLAVSRTPVHEAVLKLKEEFLIDIRPRKESKVSYIDIDMVNEGFFIRRNLEPAAMKAAMKHIGPEYRKRLMENLRTQKEIIEEGRLEEFLTCDDEFHEIIYIAANKPLNFSVVQRMGSHLTRMRYLIQIFNCYDFIPVSFREHEQMYEMLTFGTASDFSIDDYVIQHIKGFQDYLPKIVNEYRDYFKYL